MESSCITLGGLTLKQLHLIVTGRVQGVGFRYYSQNMALAQNINGWVRNLPDGSVEIIAEGEESYINNYLDSIKKGSPFSSVDSVVITENPTLHHYTSFTIKY